MKITLQAMALLTVAMSICVCTSLVTGFVRPVLANPDPLNVVWIIQDSTGTPVNGATLEIYNSTSPNGPFTKTPAEVVEDKIGGVFRNPIISGYWNPDHPVGIAWADLHIQAVSSYYFYVVISYQGAVWYWPTAMSYKPGDPSWSTTYLIASTGPTRSPSGFVASGNGLGNGVTTAYPTRGPPNNLIPDVPIGPSVAAVSMIIGFAAYVGIRRRRAISPF